MSRIGQKPIDIVAGVEVRVDGRQVIAKGPKGELTVDLPGGIEASEPGGGVAMRTLSFTAVFSSGKLAIE